ncbi:DUF4440 domain-containing protein [Acidovorax sp. LjRoot117]|uniref:nuclear transport factor 2 family protein n=1 Tax=Acidovorax sp. LjRoot117 TaxID=3342255 RepID=UPI003ECF655F
MQEQLSIENLLQEYELLLLQPAARKSEAVSRLLADGFVEFGSSGRVFNKVQIVSALQAEQPMQVHASDFKVQMLESHVALVTYKAVRQSHPSRLTLRSSIWQRRAEQWQMIFHQGTVAEAAP